MSRKTPVGEPEWADEMSEAAHKRDDDAVLAEERRAEIAEEEAARAQKEDDKSSDSEKKGSGDDESKSDSDSEEDKPAPAPTAVVWAVRIVSLAAMAVIVGYLVWLQTMDTVEPSFDIAMDYDSVVEREGRFVLPVEVRNASTNALSAVVLQGRLADGEGETVRTVTLPLMGEGERAQIELVFDSRPNAENTEFVVVSYQSP